jgi:hypothetical protein
MHSESVPGLHGRSSGLSIPLRIGRKEGRDLPGPLSVRSFLVGIKVGSGGGIRTLDIPLRGIPGGSFTAVSSRSVLPLSKPNSGKRCYSLFIGVCGGLVY